jgi:Uma2 family endonuclease
MTAKRLHCEDDPMATNPATAPAPWGEYVPGYGALDTDTYLQLPDQEGWVLELYQGRVIRKPGPRIEHGDIQSQLISLLNAFLQSKGMGRVTGTGCYILKLPDGSESILCPDISYMLPLRKANAKRRRSYYEATPDFVIKIASPPNDTHPQVQQKIGVFLAAGVSLVWVVWPNTRTVEIWRPTVPQQPSSVLHTNDTLDGQEIIPGFTCPVSAIFD